MSEVQVYGPLITMLILVWLQYKERQEWKRNENAEFRYRLYVEGDIGRAYKDIDNLANMAQHMIKQHEQDVALLIEAIKSPAPYFYQTLERRGG